MSVRRGWTSAATAVIGALMVSSVVAAAAVAAPAGAAPEGAIAPVLTVATSSTLNCSVAHRDAPRLRFFADTSCATIVVVGTRAYGPRLTPGFFPEQRPTAFTPIRQSARTGAGTSANPWRVVTLVAAGNTGVQVQQTDVWTSTSEVVHTRLDIANRAGVPQRVTVWRAGDCQADAFESFGRVRPGKATCIVSTQDGADHLIARPVPGAQVMTFAGIGGTGQIGLNGGLGPVDLAAHIVSGAAPTGGCEECNESRDRALALGWRFTIAGRNARTLYTTTTVSTGAARPQPTLALVPAAPRSPVAVARLLVAGVPLPGAYVRFLRDGAVTCVAVTDRAGRATCNSTAHPAGSDPAGLALGADPYVTAIYDGDLDRRPASARVRFAPDPPAKAALTQPACGRVTSTPPVLDYIAPSPGHGSLATAAPSCSTVRFGFWSDDPAKGGHLMAYVPGDGSRDLTVWLDGTSIPPVMAIARFRQPATVLQKSFVFAVSPGKFRS